MKDQEIHSFDIDKIVNQIYRQLTSKKLSVDEVRKVTYRINKKASENAHI